MPLIEAQYASEDGHRTARVYQDGGERWQCVRWEWRPATNYDYWRATGHDSLTAAQHAAEAWVGDREG